MTVLEIPTPDPRSFDDASRPFAEAVAARYAIKRLIGKGGMGMVYLARDRRLDRLVAIKTLPPHLARDESMRQRFLRETRTAGAMSHPNIVPIHGADEIDGHVFFVMGFVDGESLAAHIRGMGRLGAAETRGILIDVASALGHAHERGIIHRDIKAENILLDAKGRAMVTDFGIARLAEAAPLTATGQMLGTVYYSSPEQVAGDAIDRRSDLYSLGVVGFLALTGRFPFDSELASAVLVAHVNRPAPSVRAINEDVPAELAAVVDRCLRKDPAERYADAAELIAALQGINVDAPRRDGLKLVSDTEAHAVWSRAAELQSLTSARERPPEVLRKRSAPVEDGLQLKDVVQAGREAGISTRFLDRAIVEHGFTSDAATAVAIAPRKSLWASVPLQVTEQAEVRGEASPEQFDHLVNILRSATQTMGVTMAGARELGWRTEWFGHQMDVAVVPGKGTTRVQLTQRMSNMASTVMIAAMSLGLTAGFGAGRVFASSMERHVQAPWVRALAHTFGLGRQDISPIAFGILFSVWGLSFVAARLIIRRAWRWNAARLRLLAETVVANLKSSR